MENFTNTSSFAGSTGAARGSVAGRMSHAPLTGSRGSAVRMSQAGAAAGVGAAAYSGAASTARLAGGAGSAYSSSRTGADSRPRRRHNLIRYAEDNRVVRAIYSFTTGRFKPLFIALVLVAVALNVYFPVRDYYVAQRTSTILTAQKKLVKAYKTQLQSDVDSLLSEEGVKDAASKKLGMVMPGEKTIEVIGLDDDSSDSSSKKSSAPTTSAELEKALQNVDSNAPWYTRVLDVLFGFSGVNGQQVSSAGQ